MSKIQNSQRDGKAMIEIEVVTFACVEHKRQVFEAIKWHLVDKGLWCGDGLSMGMSFGNRKCFCGQPATYIIKYKLPLKKLKP